MRKRRGSKTRRYALYRRPIGSPKRTRWERVDADISGSNNSMIRRYQSLLYARFMRPEGYVYEIRPLTKKEQDDINAIEATKMLGSTIPGARGLQANDIEMLSELGVI